MRTQCDNTSKCPALPNPPLPRAPPSFPPPRLPSSTAEIDGAYFGTTLPHLLLMTYPELVPAAPQEAFRPRRVRVQGALPRPGRHRSGLLGAGGGRVRGQEPQPAVDAGRAGAGGAGRRRHGWRRWWTAGCLTSRWREARCRSRSRGALTWRACWLRLPGGTGGAGARRGPEAPGDAG